MNPTIAADGHTYERSAIEHWLKQHSMSPVTGQLLHHKCIMANHTIKCLMAEHVTG